MGSNGVAACEHPQNNNGAECWYDENVCSRWICVNDGCNPIPANQGQECDDTGNPCTEKVCDNMVCTTVDKPAGTACDDEPNECTDDVCNQGSCTHPDKPDGTPCPDEEPPNDCTDDVCDQGSCTHPAVPDGTGCEPDEDPCTDDICQGGACTHPEITLRGTCGEDDTCCDGDCCPAGRECCEPECCLPGETCCGTVPCCLPENCCEGGTACCTNCCDNDVCCPQACEGCINNGTLSGGSVTANPDAPCPDATIIFTASGVTDSGGVKRVNCTVPVPVPPVNPTYTWTLTIPPNYPPPLPPPSGTGATVSVVAKSPGTYTATFKANANRECPPPELSVGSKSVVVPDVAVVEWMTLGGNISLDGDPMNGGKRIFPGKQTPNDVDAGQRPQVHLKARLSPAVPGCTIHFRTWDVDDPFDQNNPARPDVQVIDNNASGPDNRGGVGSLSAASEDTDSTGEATVTFSVSMKPGDNFRGAASGFSEAISNVTQTHADMNNAPPGVQFTEMLTVWRKLHVELDSMGSVTGNEIDTAFTDIVGTGTALTEVTGTGTLDDGSENLDDTPPENGRFEDGTLTIGSTPSTITVSPVTGNGNNRLVFPPASIAGLPFFAADSDVVSPKETMSGTITEVVKSGGSFVWTLNVTAHDETPIDWPDFEGGELFVGGGAGVSITAAAGGTQQVATSALNIPCRVHDDDDDTLLPKLPDVGSMSTAYREAYVVPIYDVGDYNMNVSFLLNTDQTDLDWDSRVHNATAFWVAYVLSSFQDITTTDDDPDAEAGTFGVSTNPTGGSLIFLELHQPHEGVSNPQLEEQITIVHEIGHTVGDSSDEPVTENNNQDATLTSRYLNHVRSSPKPRS